MESTVTDCRNLYVLLNGTTNPICTLNTVGVATGLITNDTRDIDHDDQNGLRGKLICITAIESNGYFNLHDMGTPPGTPPSTDKYMPIFNINKTGGSPDLIGLKKIIITYPPPDAANQGWILLSYEYAASAIVPGKVKVDDNDSTADWVDPKINVENLDKEIITSNNGYESILLRARNGLPWSEPTPIDLANAWNEHIDLEFASLNAGATPRTNLYVELNGTGCLGDLNSIGCTSGYMDLDTDNTTPRYDREGTMIEIVCNAECLD